ncbi:hypothetical protein CK203_046727 [Vitis vinifera]|uniref:Uncharacterized protein n=1 Tax=Vitis vinifera TaxID=29760 RepID=A0A438H275_VITVI|nr:hypothetical protein CK203_046727 [Vitis vinifera]
MRNPKGSVKPFRTSKAISYAVPSDSPSQATKAPRIPPPEGGAATSPFFPAPQRRYKTRRPPTTPGATTLHLESSAQCPPAKRVRTLGPSESSRASQPEAPTDSKVSSDLSLESIVKCPILTTPPIEGNSDCRARLFHWELHFDQEVIVALDFYQSMTTLGVPSLTAIHVTIDGRHGILEARHIAEAL